MQKLGIPAAVVVKVPSSRRIEIEKTGLYSFLVLFSMGITKGKWSTLVTELLNFKDLYDAQCAAEARAPRAGRGASRNLFDDGAERSLRRGSTRSTASDNLPKAQRDMYTVLPEMALRPGATPTTAWCTGAWKASRSTS